MKAIVERPLTLTNIEDDDREILLTFNWILDSIHKSNGVAELRTFMVSRRSIKYFKWGFGSNHMWLHQRGINESDRILYVKFE